MKKAGKTTPSFRRRLERRAKKSLLLLEQRKHFGKQESKKLRRLLTALNIVKSPLAIPLCLRAMRQDPEHRLNEKCVKYLVSFPRRSSIATSILELVTSKRTSNYPSQQAQLFEVLKLNGCDETRLNRHARLILPSRVHWYVKQELLRALYCVRLEPQTLREVWRIFDRGDNSDLKRSALLCLICSNPRRPLEFIAKLQREIDAKVLRTGRYVYSLSHDIGTARRELASMSRIEEDRFMIDKIYKWPLIAQLKDAQVRAEAKRVLVQWHRIARRPHLKRTLRKLAQLL